MKLFLYFLFTRIENILYINLILCTTLLFLLLFLIFSKSFSKKNTTSSILNDPLFKTALIICSNEFIAISTLFSSYIFLSLKSFTI